VVPRADRSGELVRLALDGSAGSEARLAALRELAGIPGRTAVEALVGVARTLAGQDESGELALEAAALIDGADTPEAVELLSEILTDSHPGFGVFDDLPVLVQDAVRGSLRKNPDEMLVAKSLGQRFSATADPLAQSRVEMLEHPALMARLAEEARAAGDIPLMEERLALLETTRDARVFDSVVRLAEAGNVSRATLDELIYNWALRQPESVGVEQLMERLGSAAATDTSRALAAIGLAGYSEANPGYLAQLREALSKALGSGSLSPSLAQSFRGTMDLLDATR
jgi:hypothetical protein